MSSWDKEWAMCFSGRRVYPFEVKPTDVLIDDIAHALSMQVRYNGHVSRLYTVGEHCIRISDALFRDTGDAMVALTGLLHDAGETYTGDFTRPVKNSLREVGQMLKAAEDRNEVAIFEAFGLIDEMTEQRMAQVKDYDRRIIVDEKSALFGENKPWDWDLVPLDVPIIGYSRKTGCGQYNWDPERTCEEYLARFYDLSTKRWRG
jgi:hypothetical protein